MTNDSGSANKKHSSESVEVTPSPNRLPCRGCLADCSNYPTCDGRPWRIATPAAP